LSIGAGDTEQWGFQLALDPSTGAATVATSCQYEQGSEDAFRAQLSLVNLDTGSATQVFQHTLSSEQQGNHGFPGTIGGASATIGIDPVHHLILQRSLYCPQLVNLVDMNARTCLTEHDESGRLVKLEPNLFPSGFLDPASMFNGVNGASRRGVAMGQQAASILIVSTEAQPYSY
jgi:hypothetical protein